MSESRKIISDEFVSDSPSLSKSEYDVTKKSWWSPSAVSNECFIETTVFYRIKLVLLNFAFVRNVNKVVCLAAIR